MSTAPQTTPVDWRAYAETLHGYAVPRLDPFSLRCWIISRLMFDLGLDHGLAEELVDDVHAAAMKAAPRGLRFRPARCGKPAVRARRGGIRVQRQT
jgi:hypothetical protein